MTKLEAAPIEELPQETLPESLEGNPEALPAENPEAGPQVETPVDQESLEQAALEQQRRELQDQQEISALHEQLENPDLFKADSEEEPEQPDKPAGTQIHVSLNINNGGGGERGGDKTVTCSKCHGSGKAVNFKLFGVNISFLKCRECNGRGKIVA